MSMSEAKFTKGPWKAVIGDLELHIEDSSGNWIAQLWDKQMGVFSLSAAIFWLHDPEAWALDYMLKMLR